MSVDDKMLSIETKLDKLQATFERFIVVETKLEVTNKMVDDLNKKLDKCLFGALFGTLGVVVSILLYQKGMSL
jgi:hypothetical protein